MAGGLSIPKIDTLFVFPDCCFYVHAANRNIFIACFYGMVIVYSLYPFLALIKEKMMPKFNLLQMKCIDL